MESTVATEGMFGNLNPLGDGPGRSLADHGARVPEVLPAAELERFLAGLIITTEASLSWAKAGNDSKGRDAVVFYDDWDFFPPIFGGLYSVTALRKNKNEGDSVY